VVSSLRQHLLASGCLLQEERAQATYVVEARSGGIGTDRYQVLLGVPEMNVPSLMPGQPTLIPEIPLAKRTDQKGVAKLAVFAYNRRTGRPVWQSGVVRMVSTAKDTWLLGAGPFRRGPSARAQSWPVNRYRFCQIPLPLIGGKEPRNEEPPPALAVTRAASWTEPPPDPESRMIPHGTAPLLRVREPAFGDILNPGEGTAPGPADREIPPEPNRRPRQGTEDAGQRLWKDAGTRRGASPPQVGGDRHK
jgi:hypothetical protein